MLDSVTCQLKERGACGCAKCLAPDKYNCRDGEDEETSSILFHRTLSTSSSPSAAPSSTTCDFSSDSSSCLSAKTASSSSSSSSSSCVIFKPAPPPPASFFETPMWWFPVRVGVMCVYVRDSAPPASESLLPPSAAAAANAAEATERAVQDYLCRWRARRGGAIAIDSATPAVTEAATRDATCKKKISRECRRQRNRTFVRQPVAALAAGRGANKKDDRALHKQWARVTHQDGNAAARRKAQADAPWPLKRTTYRAAGKSRGGGKRKLAVTAFDD